MATYDYAKQKLKEVHGKEMAKDVLEGYRNLLDKAKDQDLAQAAIGGRAIAYTYERDEKSEVVFLRTVLPLKKTSHGDTLAIFRKRDTV